MPSDDKPKKNVFNWRKAAEMIQKREDERKKQIDEMFPEDKRRKFKK